jgi:hypothetical protein
VARIFLPHRRNAHCLVVAVVVVGVIKMNV